MPISWNENCHKLRDRKEGSLFGIPMLISKYRSYIHYLFKLSDKHAFGIAWARKPNERWYYKKVGDKPFIWWIKKELEVEKYTIKARMFYIGRLRLEFGTYKMKGGQQNGTQEKRV